MFGGPNPVGAETVERELLGGLTFSSSNSLCLVVSTPAPTRQFSSSLIQHPNPSSSQPTANGMFSAPWVCRSCTRVLRRSCQRQFPRFASNGTSRCPQTPAANMANRPLTTARHTVNIGTQPPPARQSPLRRTRGPAEIPQRPVRLAKGPARRRTAPSCRCPLGMAAITLVHPRPPSHGRRRTGPRPRSHCAR